MNTLSKSGTTRLDSETIISCEAINVLDKQSIQGKIPIAIQLGYMF